MKRFGARVHVLEIFETENRILWLQGSASLLTIRHIYKLVSTKLDIFVSMKRKQIYSILTLERHTFYKQEAVCIDAKDQG